MKVRCTTIDFLMIMTFVAVTAFQIRCAYEAHYRFIFAIPAQTAIILYYSYRGYKCRSSSCILMVGFLFGYLLAVCCAIMFYMYGSDGGILIPTYPEMSW